MSLDRFQRLVLKNQYRILAKLEPDLAETYERFEAILENGYELHYSDLMGLIESPSMTEDECTEVIRFMSMFRALKHSYDQMSDKKGVEEWQVRFAGFDGNNETKQMAYALFFHNDGERFEELRGTDFNSHLRTLGTYRRMYSAWSECGEEFELTDDQVVKIATEAIHPDHRK